MAAEHLLREVARKTKWKSIEGLWSEALNPRRYLPPWAQDTPPDPPAPFFIYDPPIVFNRDGEPLLLTFRAPRLPTPPPVFSPTSSTPPPPPPTPPPTPSPAPSTPPIPAPSADNAPAFQVPTNSQPPPSAFCEFLARTGTTVRSFDWKKGCYVGLTLLSVYVIWRCYRRWGMAVGEQRGEPEIGAGGEPRRFHSGGLADALPNVDDMLKVGDAMFGPFEWQRFDMLVLPPSFNGCPKNSQMIFLTPATINVDTEVAHELAHPWTRNIITSNTIPWINEEFTAYAERRIVAIVQGEERAALNMGLGWRGLKRMMERCKDNLELTILEPDMAGIDPDDMLLWPIKHLIGRPAFDEFLKKYVVTFKFQSIDTETFLEFLKANVPGVENQVNLEEWIEGTGIPPDAMEPDSATYRKICTLAAEFKSGRIPSEDEVADWGGEEWELYLQKLSTDAETSQVNALDELYKLPESCDNEVKVAFLHLAIPMGCRCSFNKVGNSLKLVGRTKYLRLNRQGANTT